MDIHCGMPVQMTGPCSPACLRAAVATASLMKKQTNKETNGQVNSGSGSYTYSSSCCYTYTSGSYPYSTSSEALLWGAPEFWLYVSDPVSGSTFGSFSSPVWETHHCQFCCLLAWWWLAWPSQDERQNQVCGSCSVYPKSWKDLRLGQVLGQDWSPWPRLLAEDQKSPPSYTLTVSMCLETIVCMSIVWSVGKEGFSPPGERTSKTKRKSWPS